ncbi:hypothetical protein L1987_46840 [Smallanthus sonchifolius]|uniref:Uncharacterized protein n=1 Tax=Smallanthus sonchifolius TaxID=185202 RepID=A0ACB9G0Q9_9ASTR|nr:hypothetical protein L1987_46840 [Smallanthus sonchifolius]
MFPSNLVQQFPSSIHVFPPSSSFFDHEKDGIHFNHHHHHNNQFVNRDCFFHAYNNLAPPPVFPDNIMVRQQQQQLSKGSGFQYSDDNSSLLESVIYPSKKKMANMKKDGHSKIHTSQGPRDRRVRMSIESNVTPQSSFWCQIESKKGSNERASESIMEPKSVLSSPVLYGYQHNVLVSNDLSSQIKYPTFLNLQ